MQAPSQALSENWLNRRVFARVWGGLNITSTGNPRSGGWLGDL